MTSLNLILGGVSCAFCSMEVSPSRAGGFHAPQTETHGMKIRLPAPHSQSAPIFSPLGRVIAAASSLCVRRLREPVEHCGPFKLRAPAFFSSRGLSLLTREFLPAQVLAGRVFSFLRTLVQNPQKPGRSVVHALSFSPIVYQVHLPQPAGLTGLVAVSDGHRGSKREIVNVRTSSGEVRNVVR